MDTRYLFLHWVLVACDLTKAQRLHIGHLMAKLTPPARKVAFRASTMVYKPAVDNLHNLPLADMDGLALILRSTGQTMISIKDFGWVPMAEDD